jgi:hypothetical protein
VEQSKNKMKTSGILLMVAGVIFGTWMVIDLVRDNYVYDNTIGSYWNLSVKASSLDVKSQYLDQFVSAVQAANLSGNDAIFFPTPDNSYQQNFDAILSLQTRMHAFVGQDSTTMAYQQAISQITAQEEDDNSSTIQVISDLWWKQNHYFFWNVFLGLGEIISVVLLLGVGMVMCIVAD